MHNSMLDLIAARRSHRAYKDTPVTKQQLDALMKAAMEAPSAVNRQPWHFTVVRNQELLSQMNAALMEELRARPADQRSPRLSDPDYNVFYHAPLVIFLSADPAWRYSGVDCGIAVENIALAAESMGLGSVILGMPRDIFTGAQGAAFASQLHFLPGEEFIISIAVGVPADDKEPHPQRTDRITYVD